MSKPVQVDRFRNPDNDPRGPYLLTDITRGGRRTELNYSFRGAVPPSGRSWRFSAERLAQLDTDGRLAFLRSGRLALKRYLDEVRPPNGAPTPAPEVWSVPSIVRVAMRHLAQAVAAHPACLMEVEWRDLERMLGVVFDGLGFETHVTRSTKDGGFDLDLSCIANGIRSRFLVEVKHWIASGTLLARRSCCW